MIGEAMQDFARHITHELGIGAKPGPQVPTFVDKMRNHAETVIERMVEKGFTQMGKVMEESFTKAAGFGAPPPVEEMGLDAVDLAAAPPDPKESLPFDLIPTGVKWPDGQDVMYSQNKETGEFDIRGAGFGNPFIMQQGSDLAKKLVDVAKTFAERWAAPDKAHVVGSIPKDARPADAAGAPPPPNGSPPPRWPAP
jgi:hypothetical protein